MQIYDFILVLIVFDSAGGLCGDFTSNNVFHLGTKTPYRLVAEKNDSLVEYPGCTPSKIVGIVRHGTRTPGLKSTQQMKEILSRLKEDFILNDKVFKPYKLCNASKLNIKDWAFSIESEGEKILTREGGDEMYYLAKRLQNRFPTLLTNYSIDSFLFRFTKTQRTKESAKHFTLGLFGEESKEVWYPEPREPDGILRFYKLCKKWRKKVKKSRASTEEREKFIKSVEIQEVLKSVSEKLGFNCTLSFGSVQTMYTVCGFETAWHPGRASPWCKVFNQTEIEIMEYSEELKYYWRDGYGFEINYKQSCPLFKNILSILSNEEEAARRGVFYFTHSGTLLKSLARLGLYRDGFQLTSGLTSSRRESRLWRISAIDAFGTNLVFTLFKCAGGADGVHVSHQERQVRLEGCPPLPALCPLPHVRSLLGANEPCDFQEICAL